MTISTVPSQSGTLTYNKNSQSPSWSNYDTSKMTIGGTTSGTNAGTYNATFTPKSDYCWSDGTTTSKTVSWKIGKATGTLTVSKTSVTVDKDNLTTTFTIGGNHDGTLSVKSNNTSIATVSLSGNTATIRLVILRSSIAITLLLPLRIGGSVLRTTTSAAPSAMSTQTAQRASATPGIPVASPPLSASNPVSRESCPRKRAGFFLFFKI